MDLATEQFLCTVFSCSKEGAAAIGLRATERRYPRNSSLFRQGDDLTATFLLIAGRVHALLYGPEGQALLVQEFLPGDLFGSLAGPAAAPSDSDFVAVEAVRALAFGVGDFCLLMERYNCVALAVCRILQKQLHRTKAKMAERSILSASGRICAELLRLAGQADGKIIRPIPVFSRLALRVNSTRETVSRTISGLERRGIVRRHCTTLEITAPRRLEELVI